MRHSKLLVLFFCTTLFQTIYAETCPTVETLNAAFKDNSRRLYPPQGSWNGWSIISDGQSSGYFVNWSYFAWVRKDGGGWNAHHLYCVYTTMGGPASTVRLYKSSLNFSRTDPMSASLWQWHSSGKFLCGGNYTQGSIQTCSWQ